MRYPRPRTFCRSVRQARRGQLGVLYAYTVDQGETGAAAMKFDLIVG
jgi:hypothetical protein